MTKKTALNTSPILAKSTAMTFLNALEVVINHGRKISRISWDDSNTYIYFGHVNASPAKHLAIHNSDKRANPGEHTLIVNGGDVEGDDWIVVDEGEIL